MKKTFSIQNKHCPWLPLNFWTRRVIKNTVKKTVDLLEDFIEENEKIIDIGAGGGWISQELKKRKKTENLLLDVINLNQTDLPLILYDGENIPFNNNVFDSAILICVLHHCQNPLKVLKEAKRTARKRVIIIEDVAKSRFGKIVLKIKDAFLNLGFSLLVCSLKEIINLPFNFKTIEEWEEVFKNLDFKVVYKKEFRSRPGDCKVFFVVEK